MFWRRMDECGHVRSRASSFVSTVDAPARRRTSGVSFNYGKMENKEQRTNVKKDLGTLLLD